MKLALKICIVVLSIFVGLAALANTNLKDLSPEQIADLSHLSEGADIYPYDWMKALNSITFKDPADGSAKPFLKNLENDLGLFRSDFRATAKGTYLMPYRGLSASWSDHPMSESDAFTVDERELVRNINGKKSIKMVGTSCLFCHSSNIRYRNSDIPIFGAPSMTHVRGFFQDLLRSTVVLLLKPDELEAFLLRMNVSDAGRKAKEINQHFIDKLAEESHGTLNLGKLSAMKTLLLFKYFKNNERLYKAKGAFTSSLIKLLRVSYNLEESDNIGELAERMEFLGKSLVGLKPGLYETQPGFGRLDAFGRISNMFLRGENPIKNTANVSFPWLWDTKDMALMHYTANTNSVLSRNMAQALGLGALVYDNGSKTTVNFLNLRRLQDLTYKIQTPVWQNIFAEQGEDVFKIKTEKLALGKNLYQLKCAKCHESQERVGPHGTLIKHKVFRLNEIGTDERAAVDHFVPVDGVDYATTLHELLRKIEKLECGPDGGSECSANVQKERQKIYDQRGAEFYRDTVLGKLSVPLTDQPFMTEREGAAYKARPLAGVWATGPFLHNGSVPTLFDLLQPAAKRPKAFKLRSSEFDPVHVGYEAPEVESCDNDFDCYDTQIEGNSNSGHEFGVNWSREEKMSLIEYLKVLGTDQNIRSER